MCDKFYQARVCVSTDGNMDRRTHGQADTPTNGHTDTRVHGQMHKASGTALLILIQTIYTL